MHGIFAPVSDKLDPSSFQIANRLDPFLRADLSKHTTTAVERLPQRREYLLLWATFLAAEAPLAAEVIGCVTQRKVHHEAQSRRLPIGTNGRTVGSSG